jgi:glycosyltransferase involved in cell wall biosynthesis
LQEICFVLPSWQWHPVGGYKIVYQHANYLAEAGYSVSVLHMRTGKRSWIPDIPRRLAYRVGLRLRPSWFPVNSGVQIRNYAVQREKLIPVSAGLLVATAAQTAHFVHEVAALRNIPSIYLIQDVELWSASRLEVEESWRLPFKRVVVSGWLWREVGSCGLDCEVVRNGIDLSEFRRGQTVDNRPPSVLAMISPQILKRSDLAVDVLRGVHTARPDAKLRTFGVCKRPLGLPIYVEHTRNPSREELADLYASSSVYLCTSDFEGFGLPVAEALASGAAVVSTDNGGVPDYLGPLIRYAPRGDVACLTEQVVALLADPAELSRIATEGGALVGAMSITEAGRKFAAVCARLMT